MTGRTEKGYDEHTKDRKKTAKTVLKKVKWN